MPFLSKRFVHLSVFALLLLALGPGRAHGILDNGIVFGLNYASLDDIQVGDVRTTYETKTGYHFGLYAKTAVGPFGVRVSAVYLDAGPLFSGLSEEIDQWDFEDDFDVSFFVVPIDLQYRLITPGVTPYVLAGPELRFNTTSSSDFEDNFKSTMWGANIGVGVELTVPVIEIRLAPEFRYSFDLTDMTEEALTVGGVDLDASKALETGGTYHVRLHFSF